MNNNYFLVSVPGVVLVGVITLAAFGGYFLWKKAAAAIK